MNRKTSSPNHPTKTTNHGELRGHEVLAVREPEACKMLSVGRTKLFELVSDGKIQVIKCDRLVLYPVAELKRFLQTPERFYTDKELFDRAFETIRRMTNGN